MGMELPVENVESHDVDAVNVNDSELVYHVREALTAALSVWFSLTSFFFPSLGIWIVSRKVI